MTRTSEWSGKHECVSKALKAAEMSFGELCRAYPYSTAQGWNRVSDTGNLYRRIGERIKRLPEAAQAILRSIEPHLTLNRLRRIGVTERQKSDQECTALVYVWKLEIEKRNKK